MNHGRQFAISSLVLVLLCAVDCEKKKPQLPPQAKAPVDTIAVPLPNQISEETVPSPPPPPAPPVVVQEQPKAKPPTKRKRKSTHETAATTTNSAPSTTPPPSPSNGNTTIATARPPANPAAETPPDTAIAANVSGAQLTQQKQTTAQLIDATEKTLNGLNRTLSHDDEEVVSQVRSYVAQSRKATTDGDFERAYNLATKAHLLSDALVKK